MTNIDVAFQKTLGADKVRIAKAPLLNINSKDSVQPVDEDGTMCTILSLMAKGNMNCAGRDLNQTLFGDELDNPTESVTTTGSESLRKAEEERKKQQEEEARRAEEERARLQREQEEAEEAKRLKEQRKKNSWLGRLTTSITNFGKSLVEPETDNN